MLDTRANPIGRYGLNQDSNYLIQINEVLQIAKCNSIAELLQNVKRSYREKKFCLKIFKLVEDIEGRKPDSYKNCWRWIRQVINDFVQLKRVSLDQQKTLLKLDHLLKNK